MSSDTGYLVTSTKLFSSLFFDLIEVKSVVDPFHFDQDPFCEIKDPGPVSDSKIENIPFKKKKSLTNIIL